MGEWASSHIFFIPGVLLLGLVLGYVMGSRATRADMEKRRKRMRQ